MRTPISRVRCPTVYAVRPAGRSPPAESPTSPESQPWRPVSGCRRIAASHFFQGKPAEAREPAEKAFQAAPWHSGVVGFLAGLLARNGEKERAEKLIASMRGMIPIGMVFYHLVCSEIDAAVDWYERRIEQRQPMATQLAAARFFEPLRSSPRWPKLARMMNLPESGS